MQADFEALVIHPQIPELVLQDDGHFVGILLAQARGNCHARRMGAEGDVEMVLAGQAVARRVGQNLANHAAQRVLNLKIVANQICRH